MTDTHSGIAGIYKHAGFGARPTVTSLRDVSAAEFIRAYAAHLKKSGKLTLPDWVDYVKTAPGREMPPLDPDWYYVRAAALARKIYLNHGLGVGALAHWFGKAKAVGNKPQHHHKASRKVIRSILNAVSFGGSCSLASPSRERTLIVNLRSLPFLSPFFISAA